MMRLRSNAKIQQPSCSASFKDCFWLLACQLTSDDKLQDSPRPVRTTTTPRHEGHSRYSMLCARHTRLPPVPPVPPVPCLSPVPSQPPFPLSLQSLPPSSPSLLPVPPSLQSLPPSLPHSLRRLMPRPVHMLQAVLPGYLGGCSRLINHMFTHAACARGCGLPWSLSKHGTSTWLCCCPVTWAGRAVWQCRRAG